MTRRALISFALALIVPLFFLDLGFLPDFVDPLYPLAHIGFFFLAGALLLNILDGASGWRQFGAVMAVTLIAGGAVEGLQYFTRRNPSWHDLGCDLIGALLAFVFLSRASQRQPITVRLTTRTAALALTVWASLYPLIDSWDTGLADRQFPVLSDFETRWQARRWSRGEIDHSLSRNGNASLKVELTTAQYSGTTLKRSLGDWSGYQTLQFSIYNPDPEPLQLTISIRDEEHFRRGTHYDDRFNESITVNQGWNDYSIPLLAIKQSPANREMNLANIKELKIFTVDPSERRQVN
ncbi:MAG: hypothetical protein RBS22_08780, partial [Spongiibacteraceae bacterium]|nr:hypothetical protein [Spongiibacteraceae bacterium]